MKTPPLKQAASACLAIMIMLFVSCFSGCTSNTDDKVLTKANTALKTIKNCNTEMTIDFQYSLGSVTTQPPGGNLAEFTGLVFSERTFLETPIRIKEKATATLNDQTTTEGYYMVQNDDTLRFYFFNNNEWSYIDRSLSESGQSQPDPTSNIAFVMTYATDFVQIAVEEQEGKEVYHYQAKLSGDALITFVEGLGMIDNLSSSDKPEIKPEAFDLTATVAEMGSQNIDIWIEKSTNIPFRYTLDLSPVAGKLLENALRKTPDAGETPCHVGRFLVDVTYKNINNATDFELPPETQNAKDLSIIPS